MLTDYAMPRSLRQWGLRHKSRALCRRMRRRLDLAECLHHVDCCRTCREEIAKRRGLGHRLSTALIRKHGREAIEISPLT